MKKKMAKNAANKAASSNKVSSPKSKKRLFIVCGILVVAIIAFAAVLGLKYSKHKNKLPDETSTTEMTTSTDVTASGDTTASADVKKTDANNGATTNTQSVPEEWKEWKQQNEAWLTKNAKKKGITTLQDGLQYKVLKKGNGEKPVDDAMVKVNYTLTDINGKTLDHNDECEFRLMQGSLIKGFIEGLELMPVGSKYEIYVPQELGYGERSIGGDLKPYSTLIFTVELLGIKK